MSLCILQPAKKQMTHRFVQADCGSVPGALTAVSNGAGGGLDTPYAIANDAVCDDGAIRFTGRSKYRKPCLPIHHQAVY